MPDNKRLIEVAFPLKQASLDSGHEKNVRHGHISTLHIWPARRPLAASRAALIAALLPDPADPEKRRQILERMAGRVVEKIERKKVGGRTVEKVKEETVGGILHWGRENGPDLDWFREEIRKAYGGRAPKVLDPFAGGGAIPLEAMRLGCEVTAVDINPVAWFILKCTLEYPQKLAGQTRPLPEFALRDREFMEAFLKAKGFKGASLRTMLERLGHGDGSAVQLDALPHDDPTLQADLAWHVRAWGRWVLSEARKKLARYYPTYAEFEPLELGMDPEPRPMRLLDVDGNGVPQLDPLNAEFDEAYLKDPRNPRWVMKPTVAYLWARTVTCKQCRATVPLLKTRWLAKKDNKRVLLIMEPNAERTGVVFGIQKNVSLIGGNVAQRREHDKRIGAGTMSRAGATCPSCGTIMTSEDMRFEGRAGRLGQMMTVVVVDGPKGKEYRLPTGQEINAALVTQEEFDAIFANLPFGLPTEFIPLGGSRTGGGSPFTTPTFGIDQWAKLFTNRQLTTLGIFISAVHNIHFTLASQEELKEWSEAICSLISAAIDRLADYNSNICNWDCNGEYITHTFQRFALPIKWDFAEINPHSGATGDFLGAVDWIARFTDHAIAATTGSPAPNILLQSALGLKGTADVIVTDPPYYDAIPYSDLMDFFYVWLRRSLHGLSSDLSSAFGPALSPKWNHATNDGELIDDPSRFDGDKARSKANYESGMFHAFQACINALSAEGRMVVVFANKQPDAWETLVGALIRAGFVVDGSWPIQTEMGTRTRAMASAALASSVWLVCRKRNAAQPGWDNKVLTEMRANITQKLREFWDAGIRGPDFVWAATGPALEVFSRYPVVKKADTPGQAMTVSEFLREVRRIVVDFVVGRVLTRVEGESDMLAAESLDDVTTYYLLHRHDFQMEEAPIGACILYALSCNLSDSALVNQYDLLGQTGKASADEDEGEEAQGEEDADEEASGSSGAKVKLKGWNQRRGRNLGLEAPGGRPVPLIDQVHKLMHLWRAGDQVKVDDYLETRGLKRNALFNQLLQALIELAPQGSEERSILESISNHVAAREGIGAPRQGQLV
jgi:adenine-specific DNA methylase